MRKALLTCILAACIFSTLPAQDIQSKLTMLNTVLPTEKIYVHTDRTLYAPDEDVFFKAYVLNGEHLGAADNSRTISVNLLDAKGSVKESKQLELVQGKAWGSFSLKNYNGGIYKIKAYTNWTGNLGEEYVFEKEITVQEIVYTNLLMKMETERKTYLPGQKVNAWLTVNDLTNNPVIDEFVLYEVLWKGKSLLHQTGRTDANGKGILSFVLPDSISSNEVMINAQVTYKGNTESIFKAVVLDLDKPDVAFLPEGGNLVFGLQSAVAFRAIGKNGKPVEVQGEIQDDKGYVVTTFRSLKHGMGKFIFTPLPGKVYTAYIQSSNGRKFAYALPAPQHEGLVLSCEAKANTLQLNIHSTLAQRVRIVLQSHGTIFHSEFYNLQAGKNPIALSTDSLAAGIAQVTVFENEAPLAERLVFVHPERTLTISISSNKDNYSPFEKVKLKIKVHDDHDKPVDGNFSLSVADEKNLAMADDKQNNILSQLLLSSELKGRIEEPAFYFKKDEPLAAEALDLVMLTHGWRRYTWNDVLTLSENDWKKRIVYQKDVFGYSGVIYRAHYWDSFKRPVKVKLPFEELQVMSDSNGVFVFPVDHISFPATLRIRKGMYTETHEVSESELTKYRSKVIYNPNQQNGSLGVMNTEPKRQQRPDRVELTEQETISAGNISEDYGRVRSLDEVSISALPGVSSEALTLSSNSLACVAISTPYSSLIPTYGYSISPFYAMDEYVFGIHNNGWSNTFSEPYSKEFYSPQYTDDVRGSNAALEDDRKTLFWKPAVTTKKGEAEVEFYTCRNISAYTVIAEGCGLNGQAGYGKHTFYTEKPFYAQAKLPVIAAQGDKFTVNLIIRNNTPKRAESTVKLSQSRYFKPIDMPYAFTCSVPADSFVVKEIPYEVLFTPLPQNPDNQFNGTKLSIDVESGVFKHQVMQEINIVKTGFDHYAATGGNKKVQEFSFNIKETVGNEVDALFELIINPFKQLDQALAGMIREPGGCFEQVSSTNYPNILALQCLQKSKMADASLQHKAMQQLQSGYKQLAKYETTEGGFEWYGHTPPHEALTAMGLMQFYEMEKLGVEVDKKLFDRTVKWLYTRRTASGLFQQNKGKYGFSAAPAATSSAYVTYALSCIGETNLEPEIKFLAKDVHDTFDFYKAALLANTYFHLKKNEEGVKLVKELVQHIDEKGMDNIQTGPSVTYCYSPKLECVALLVIAIADNNLEEYKPLVEKYLGFIYSKNRYGGSFGSTQETVLALRAIMSASEFLSNTKDPDGKILVSVNDKKPVELAYNSTNTFLKSHLGHFLACGNNKVRIEFSGSAKAYPSYTFSANWKEQLPVTAPSNKLNLQTSFSKETYALGEMANMNVTLKNTTNEGLPQTVIIVGTPAGMSFDIHELKRLSDDRIFDYYELRGNDLVLYFAELAPNADINIPLNLKTEIKGVYKTAPSCAYLYYNSEYKSWSNATSIQIR